MNMMPEILLLPAPASPVVGFLPPPRPALLMLPAPQIAGLLPAPSAQKKAPCEQVVFWDSPKRTRLPVDVQAALDPATEQLLKQVEVYLTADSANPDLLTRAAAEFTQAVQRVGREQCGHKRSAQQSFAGRTQTYAAPGGHKFRTREEHDEEIREILAKHEAEMKAKFGGANGAHAWH